MATEESPAQWKDSITIPFTKEKEILYSVGNIEAWDFWSTVQYKGVGEKIQESRILSMSVSTSLASLLEDQPQMQYLSSGKYNTSMLKRRRGSTMR